MEWKFVEDEYPPENEYLLVKSSENAPVGISRLVDNEWETGFKGKIPIFTKHDKYYTSCSFSFWMRLPI